MRKSFKKTSAVFMAIIMLLTQLSFAVPLAAAGNVEAVINGTPVSGADLASCISQVSEPIETVEVLSGTVTSLGCLKGNTTIKSIVFSTDVEGTIDLDWGHFENSVLEVVEVPQIRYVAGNAFKNCKKLERIVVAKTQAENSVNSDAFNGCAALKFADIGAAHNISQGVFNGCTELETVIALGCNEIQYEAFKDCGKIKTLYLPASPKGGFVSVSAATNTNFAGCPSGRTIILCGEDGAPVSGEDLKTATELYLGKQGIQGAATGDGDGDDKLWFGWGIGGVTVDDDGNVTVDETTVNAVISGTVTYSDGTPAGFVTVELSDGTTTKTDSNGNYSIGGTFDIGDVITATATDGEGKTASKTVTIASDKTSYTADIVIDLGTTGGDENTIKVPVKGGEEGGTVIVDGEEKEIDGDGNITVDIPDDGNITVTHPDGSTEDIIIKDTDPADGVNDKGVTLKYEVTFRIVDKDTKALIYRSALTLDGTRVDTSNTTGEFKVKGMELGKEYSAEARADEYIGKVAVEVVPKKDANGAVEAVVIPLEKMINGTCDLWLDELSVYLYDAEDSSSIGITDDVISLRDHKLYSIPERVYVELYKGHDGIEEGLIAEWNIQTQNLKAGGNGLVGNLPVGEYNALVRYGTHVQGVNIDVNAGDEYAHIATNPFKVQNYVKLCVKVTTEDNYTSFSHQFRNVTDGGSNYLRADEWENLDSPINDEANTALKDYWIMGIGGVYSDNNAYKVKVFDNEDGYEPVTIDINKDNLKTYLATDGFNDFFYVAEVELKLKEVTVEVPVINGKKDDTYNVVIEKRDGTKATATITVGDGTYRFPGEGGAMATIPNVKPGDKITVTGPNGATDVIYEGTVPRENADDDAETITNNDVVRIADIDLSAATDTIKVPVVGGEEDETVKVDNVGYPIIKDTDGTYYIEIPKDTVGTDDKITVTNPDKTNEDVAVSDAGNDGKNDASIVLKYGATITVEESASPHALIPTATLQTNFDTGSVITADPVNKGQFKVTGLFRGKEYTVTGTAPGYTSATKDKFMITGTSDHLLQLRISKLIKVEIPIIGGNASEEIKYTYHEKNAGDTETEGTITLGADGTGTITIPGVPDGSTITITDSTGTEHYVIVEDGGEKDQNTAEYEYKETVDIGTSDTTDDFRINPIRGLTVNGISQRWINFIGYRSNKLNVPNTVDVVVYKAGTTEVVFEKTLTAAEIGDAPVTLGEAPDGFYDIEYKFDGQTKEVLNYELKNGVGQGNVPVESPEFEIVRPVDIYVRVADENGNFENNLTAAAKLENVSDFEAFTATGRGEFDDIHAKLVYKGVTLGDAHSVVVTVNGYGSVILNTGSPEVKTFEKIYVVDARLDATTLTVKTIDKKLPAGNQEVSGIKVLYGKANDNSFITYGGGTTDENGKVVFFRDSRLEKGSIRFENLINYSAHWYDFDISEQSQEIIAELIRRVFVKIPVIGDSSQISKIEAKYPTNSNSDHEFELDKVLDGNTITIPHELPDELSNVVITLKDGSTITIAVNDNLNGKDEDSANFKYQETITIPSDDNDDGKVTVIIPEGDITADDTLDIEVGGKDAEYTVEDGKITITEPQNPGDEIVIKDKDGNVIDKIVVPEDGSDADKDNVPDNGSVTTRPIEDNRETDGSTGGADGKVDVIIPIGPDVDEDEIGDIANDKGEDLEYTIDDNGNIIITDPQTPGDEIIIKDKDGNVIDKIVVPGEGTEGDYDKDNTNDDKVITRPIEDNRADDGDDDGKVEIEIPTTGDDNLDDNEIIVKDKDGNTKDDVDIITDENGTITIPDLEPGDKVIIKKDDGTTVEVTVPEEGSADDKDTANTDDGKVKVDEIDLTPKDDGDGSIDIPIDGGKPGDKIDVILPDGEEKEVEIGGDGDINIPGPIDEGDKIIIIKPDGDTEEIIIGGETDTDGDGIPETKPITLTYKVSGTVTDANGNPIANASVKFGRKTVKTDADGNYVITGLTNGTAGSLKASKSGYASETGSFKIEEANAVVDFTLAKRSTSGGGGSTDNGDDGKVDVEIPTEGGKPDDIIIVDKDGGNKYPDIDVDGDGTITIPGLNPGDKVIIKDENGNDHVVIVPDDNSKDDNNKNKGEVEVDPIHLPGGNRPPEFVINPPTNDSTSDFVVYGALIMAMAACLYLTISFKKRMTSK